ncbi:shufflon system plasmid conjugative transfer pilus tip adhesin PilV [Burkholderia stabilis]|uniref:shufflon system plasmid conjugative transfer pilus tip adhesin PilV n=1 Tax=Burkholderia stabilis TaxID=95485 RepID=UPI001F4A6F6A|nr:shufflon system plasmid conjugative transfer pilus tip adhesin PilV [Burkholderia stabilis]
MDQIVSLKNLNRPLATKGRHGTSIRRWKLRQRGSMLLDTALALTVATIALTGQMAQTSEAIDESIAKATGQWAVEYQGGLNGYYSTNGQAIMANQGVAGVASPYAPTIAELINLGYLPQGFGSKAPNGQVFTSNVTQVCPGGNCTLAGYVYSSTPYKDATGAVRNDLAGIAMQAAGADAGMTPPGQAGQLVGTGNGWQTPMAGVQVGTFAMRVGSYSATDAILSQFYMLNGSRALTGAMNANGNNINSVGNLSAQGKIATNGLNPNDLPSGWGGGVRTWDVYAGGTVGVGAGGGAIPLAYMNNTGLVQGQTVNSNGNVNASGTLWSNGGVVTNGNMTLATSNAQISNPGRMHINVGENLYLQPWSGGSTIIGGGGGSGNLQVNGTTWMYGPTVNQGYTYLNGGGVVNSSLSMAATAWAGWGCSGNGITTDPNGQLLSCQSGVWSAAGGGGSAVAYCKSTSCGVTLPSAGTWDISGIAYAQQAAWSGATFWINGAVVDTNANWGDQAGTGYGIMTGAYRIAVGGPTYISASTSWGSAWGDFTINLHATKE